MFNKPSAEASSRSLKDYAAITAKGMAMGAADIVPGVSGGTIALITGIYQELLASIKGLTPAALLVLFRSGFTEFWRHINGNFLLALFVGILISLKTFATIVSWALEEHVLIVWGMFSGLILASLYCLFREQEKWALAQYLLFLLGAAVVVGIAIVKPTQVPAEWWMLFLGGFIAICAMILPGISGSFILLLIGLYPVFISALEELNLFFLASFACGCASGLLVFSRFLSWLLERFYSNTLAVMMGFLLGSLYVTWPWKQVIESSLDRHGELIPLVQKNVSPWTFEQLVGEPAQLIGVVLAAGFGFFLVLMMGKVSENN